MEPRGAVYWMQLLSLVITILGGLVAIYIAFAVRTLHVIVNSRLTELLKVTGGEQRALGDAEGTERERTRKVARGGRARKAGGLMLIIGLIGNVVAA